MFFVVKHLVVVVHELCAGNFSARKRLASGRHRLTARYGPSKGDYILYP
jgi:hypothetical protein